MKIGRNASLLRIRTSRIHQYSKFAIEPYLRRGKKEISQCLKELEAGKYIILLSFRRTEGSVWPGVVKSAETVAILYHSCKITF
jgi:hypothetical protein